MFRPQPFPQFTLARGPARRWVGTAGLAKRIAGRLTNRSGVPQANLSGLSWAFFDVRRPSDIAGAPVASGTNFATDAAGNFAMLVPGTALAVGVRGLLVVSSSNGADVDDLNERGLVRRAVVSAA
jgi:hypothetical protein